MPRTATPSDQVFDEARLALQQLMEERGVSQEELGRALGLNQSTISNRLTGRSHLNLADIRRAALYFGVSPEVFFNRPSSPSASSETPIAA